MKIFQTIRKQWLTFGVGLHQRSFNTRILRTLFSLSLCIFSSVAYFFCVAKTFQEYAESVFWIGPLINCNLMYAIIVWRMQQIFEYLDEIEIMVNESKTNLNENTCEKLLIGIM